MPIGFPSTPTNGDLWPTADPIWVYNSTSDQWLVINDTPETPVGTGLGTTGTVNLDFAALNGTIQTVTLTGNPTFTTSNRATGRTFELRLSAGGSTRTLTWPSWVAFGAALPTSLASGKVLSVALRCLGTTDVAIDAVAVESA